MAAKAKTKKKGAVARQVAAESTLKFGPQRATLAAATQQAVSDYASDRKVNRQTAKAVVAAADAAQPAVESAFSTADAANAKAHERANADMAGLSPSADVFKGEAAAQSQGASQRLASAIQQHANNLADVKVRAVQGRAQGNVAAKAKLSSSLAKIGDQLQQMGVEKGAFDVAQTEEIRTTKRKDATTRRGQDVTAANSRRSTRSAARNSKRSAAQSERNSVRSSGLDPDTGKPIPGGKLDPKAAKKPATPAQVSAARQQLAVARSQVTDNKATYSRSELAHDLVNGVPASTVTDPKTGQKLKDPGIKQADQFFASIALDLGYDGHISKSNQAELARRGITLADLGLAGKDKAAPKKKAAPKAAWGAFARTP